ncbi:MAG: Gfo/Idh/MocA family oxidoreductase, partial [Piscinibacter sp.]|uniref:Gfo/Idh/MocA family oxidoreductase n=1 Tax=Piscinibacter sp. TaxID=1903157 RepID=UPI003D1370AA
MTSTALRVGLVGYGYAGQTFHAPLIAGVPGLQLAAVASRDAARVHADWPAAEVLADPQALLRRADIDLVVIASPNDTHFPLARAALAAGRHVV